MQLRQQKINKSFCPYCLDIVESEVIEKSGQIYLRISCPSHGCFEGPHKWNKPKHYRVIRELINEDIKRYPIALSIDVTYDCNQNCNFCYAQANEKKEKNPTFSEIIEKITNFHGTHVYITGGEPTLRDDLPEIIHMIKSKGFIVILTTNGKKLRDIRYAGELKNAGLDIVQLQFDTMVDSQCEYIRNEKLTDLKLNVIDNLKKTKIIVYLWVPLIKGLNDNQIKNIITFTAQNSFMIKRVAFVPMWREGRTKEHSAITINEIIEVLDRECGINKDKFIDYIKFDFYYSLLYQRLTKSLFFNYQPCSVNYRFFYINKVMIPLSDIIDLKKVVLNLEITCNLLVQKGIIGRIKCFCKIPYLFFIREFMLNKKIRPLTLIFLRAIFLSIFLKCPSLIKDACSFEVKVEGLFDRYNSDFAMLRHCNLYAYHKEELIPFCQKEIIRKK